jgi:hypothetical protein
VPDLRPDKTDQSHHESLLHQAIRHRNKSLEQPRQSVSKRGCNGINRKPLLHGYSACVKFATNSPETDFLALFHPGRFSVFPAGRNQKVNPEFMISPNSNSKLRGQP